MEESGNWPGSASLHDLFHETSGDQGGHYPAGTKAFKVRERFVASGGVARTVFIRPAVWQTLCGAVAAYQGLDEPCISLIFDLSLRARDGTKHAVSGDEIGWRMTSTDAFPNIPIIDVFYTIDGGEVDVMFVWIEQNRFEVREKPDIQTRSD